MDAGQLALLITFMTTFITSTLGFFALKYKASAANVDRLMARTEGLELAEERCQKRIEELHSKLNALMEAGLKTKQELHEAKSQIMTLKVVAAAQDKAELAKNTALTEKTLDVVKELAIKVEAIKQADA